MVPGTETLGAGWWWTKTLMGRGHPPSDPVGGKLGRVSSRREEWSVVSGDCESIHDPDDQGEG